jgi:hypothetical protein
MYFKPLNNVSPCTNFILFVRKGIFSTNGNQTKFEVGFELKKPDAKHQGIVVEASLNGIMK